MAEKRTANNYDTIMKSLNERKFSPVYLLMGNEPYYIDKISDFIANNAIKPEERDFNQIVLYGLDTTPAQIMDAAHAVPMMAEYQVIIVKEAQLLKGIESLEKYLKNPIPTTILVICYKKEQPKSKNAWINEASKHGVVFESKKIKDNALPSFISSYLAKRGKTIDQKACMMMVEHIGADLNRVASELDKLLITLPQNELNITPEFVERQIGISKDYNIFEFRDAIVRKDVLKANRIMKYFDKNPKAANLHSVVPQLFSFFQNLMIAHYCPNQKTQDNIADWLGLKNAWAAKDYMTAMRLYNATKTMHIIQKLRSIAAKSNGLDRGNSTDGELMQELIFFILH